MERLYKECPHQFTNFRCSAYNKFVELVWTGHNIGLTSASCVALHKSSGIFSFVGNEFKLGSRISCSCRCDRRAVNNDSKLSYGVQVTAHSLWLGYSLAAATDAARLHYHPEPENPHWLYYDQRVEKLDSVGE
jgi:hypothetical protein